MRRVKRVKKRKTTAAGFLVAYAAIFFVLIIAGTTVLIIYTTDKAVTDSARRTLGVDAGWAGRHVTEKYDGSFALDHDQRTETKNCTIILISKSGEVIDGEYPAEMSIVSETLPNPSEPVNFQVLTYGQNVFYVYDYSVRAVIKKENGSEHDRHHSSPGDLYTRAVIVSDNFHTVYHDVRKVYFAFLLLLIILFGIGGIRMYRRTSRPMQEMCEQARFISASPDFSHYLENPGPFYETEILTEAYNGLIRHAESIVRQHEEFNENVSHELRTPVALIRSECELIEDMYSDDIPEEAAEAIAVIHRQSDRMNSMISELLYLARASRDSYEMRMETMDLADIAESVCEGAEDLMGQHRTFVCNTEPAETLMDVSLMMIAVQNLISNALKFSPEGSTIEISTGCRGDKAFLSVRDEGCGISSEDLSRIFEPYYQVKGERNSEGFGLGLSLVRKIVEKHRGSMEVVSEPGKGSSFCIYLPAYGRNE